MSCALMLGRVSAGVLAACTAWTWAHWLTRGEALLTAWVVSFTVVGVGVHSLASAVLGRAEAGTPACWPGRAMALVVGVSGGCAAGAGAWLALALLAATWVGVMVAAERLTAAGTRAGSAAPGREWAR
jgi:hypothetical protein